MSKRKIISTKPGTIITTSADGEWSEFRASKWKVIKVYPNLVLAVCVKIPQIRRCFNYADLLMMGMEV